MRNAEYDKLQLVLIAVKDWGDFLKLGGNSSPLPETSL